MPEHSVEIALPKTSDPPVPAPLSAAELRGLVRRIEKEHAAVEHGMYSAVLHAYAAGNLLLQAKAQVEHKSWLTWLKENFGAGTSRVSVRMCQRYMQVALTLNDLPGFIVDGEESSDATRVSLRRGLLQEQGLQSIRDVLRLKASVSIESTNAARPPAASRTVQQPRLTDQSADEWLTPDNVIPLILLCFDGDWDLDPCACHDPKHHLTANCSLTIADDGLKPDVPWHGNVYVHPPRSALREWVNKAVAEFDAGRAQEVLLLLPAITDAQFNGPLQPYPRAYLRERLMFPTPDGTTVRSDVPYMLTCLTEESRYAGFADSVGGDGDVYLSYRFD